MAILFFLGLWTFVAWLVQKLVRRSFGGIGAEDSNAWRRVEIPDTVPGEWIEAYGAENDA